MKIPCWKAAMLICLLFSGTMDHSMDKWDMSKDSGIYMNNMVLNVMDPQSTTVENYLSTVRTVTAVEGNSVFNCQKIGKIFNSCRLDGKMKNSIWISNKLRNKRIKMTNGNRVDRNVVKYITGMQETNYGRIRN